jgi:hypothetical protein
MGIQVTYTAESLDDIADEFERKATELTNVSSSERSNQVADVWKQAALILRRTSLVPRVQGGRD